MQVMIMIDLEKVVEVWGVVVASDGDSDGELMLDVDNASILLTAWRDLNPSKRAFYWKGVDSNEDLVVAHFSENGGLALDWVAALWDGETTHDGHALSSIAKAVGEGVLTWGVDL